jgi:hypothetical protein
MALLRCAPSTPAGGEKHESSREKRWSDSLLDGLPVGVACLGNHAKQDVASESSVVEVPVWITLVEGVVPGLAPLGVFRRERAGWSQARKNLSLNDSPLPECTASQIAGSSGVVQVTRWFLRAGISRNSPGPISTMPSANSILAAPFSTSTHSLVGWSYQKPAGERWPCETILPIRIPGACRSDVKSSSGSWAGRLVTVEARNKAGVERWRHAEYPGLMELIPVGLHQEFAAGVIERVAELIGGEEE